MVAGISGVQIGPGATAFTRMPFSASSWARVDTNADNPDRKVRLGFIPG
jgi:hypothetical protein